MGCIVGIVPWIFIFINLIGDGVMTSSNPKGVPQFVVWIFVSIFLFFNTFSINMVLQYKKSWLWYENNDFDVRFCQNPYFWQVMFFFCWIWTRTQNAKHTLERKTRVFEFLPAGLENTCCMIFIIDVYVNEFVPHLLFCLLVYLFTCLVLFVCLFIHCGPRRCCRGGLACLCCVAVVVVALVSRE